MTNLKCVDFMEHFAVYFSECEVQIAPMFGKPPCNLSQVSHL
jgi:hypothetical protein